MIFAYADHIELIIAGVKTQTRRESDRYRVGRTYAVQPCRTCPGIPEGRILILDKWTEYAGGGTISAEDGEAEGCYTPEEYERLYEEKHSGWVIRYAYRFRFVPSEAGA